LIPKDPADESRVRESFSCHLAPAQGTAFLACGRVLRPGRTLAICQADVFATGGGERALIAIMPSTIIVRPRKRR
jgi:acyl-coenzyme A thioesterase PaaI-like protein